jgi:hypothetical protein
MGLFVRCARQCGKLHKNGGVAEWTKAAALKAYRLRKAPWKINGFQGAFYCLLGWRWVENRPFWILAGTS